jgi:hypothetical protein
MQASLNQRITRPLCVSASFLRELDGRLQEPRTRIISHFSKFHGVDEKTLLQIVESDTPSSNNADNIVAEQLKENIQSNWTITWQNKITLNVKGVDSAIEALETEFSLPESIEVEYGSYRSDYTKVQIDDSGYPIRIIARGSKKDVNAMRTSIDDCLRKHEPELGILHDMRTKSILMLGLLFASIANVFLIMESVSISSYGGSLGTFFGAAMVGGLVGVGVTHFYVKAFPVVVWKFGRGLRQASFQKIFIGVFLTFLTAVALPLILAKQ